ncbi:heparinase II/III-family protein, partial [Ruminococcaceae bacterium OttesenSCG-928-A16]|nr:heparinase II/III-family protein [Ruminococcaceae bacterium OttesenSCG-928-A16]
TSKAFADSGNYYLRSSWQNNATFAHFHCGTLGAGHGHADQLHIDLFSRGEDVLVDAGRYTYVFNEGRAEYKNLDAHNTIRVDGQDYYICKDSWECEKLTRAVNQQFFANEHYAYAEGGVLAYLNLAGGGVFVNRRAMLLGADILVLADEFYGEGEHSYEQFFHFNNAGTLSGQGNAYQYQGAQVQAQVQFVMPSLASKVLPSKLSRQYNRAEENQMIQTQFAANGFACAYTVIALGNAQNTTALSVQKLPVQSNFKGITFPAATIEALDIQYGNQHYTLAIAHQEFATPTDTFLADGCTGFGNVVAFNRAVNETEIGTVLRY